jgi:hypothetical protein
VLRRDEPFVADHRGRLGSDSAVAAHLLLDGFNHVVLVVEVALIAEFGAYWLVQTVELWNTPTRDELVDAECRPRGERLMQAL